ncbi:MAG TPA: ATP-binding cassette domain-containing protein [Candidatus Angelobacter sp.]|nr:ATP-binding cassette domain-containing protein [Candidatus Angelobacter sp.]
MADRDEGAAIEFVDVTYRTAEGRVLLSKLNLRVLRGETLVLLGRSGSGKTTTLKLINGLLTCQEGSVIVDGKPVSSWDLIRLRRHIGYAIQDVGLFPHITVERNVGLVPTLEKWPLQRIRTRVEELLQLVGLPAGEFRRRYPNQLSGGQRQRVGLGRALAADPPILLMDEPFGALDPLTRAVIQREFKSLQQRLNKTVVFVTHDVREAMLLATRIAVLDEGRMLGVYSPRDFLQSKDAVVSDYVNVLRSEMELFQGLES